MRRITVILGLVAVQVLLIGVVIVGAMSLRESAANSEPATSQWRGAAVEPPIVLEDFSVPSTSGENFTLSEHRGEVILLFVGYTSCPDYCPNTLAVLNRVYKALGDRASQVKVVFVTGDPERDSLDRMTTYVAAFNPEFVGIRAEGEELQSLLGQFYASATKEEIPASALGYTIDHTTRVYLIDQSGEWILHYAYGTPYQDIAADVEKVLEQP